MYGILGCNVDELGEGDDETVSVKGEWQDS